ncbi:MAG: glycosyltransferase [Ignavibacteriaceae bacterium]|jgi:glycosyltransferase involved in cell wall biosynthesis
MLESAGSFFTDKGIELSVLATGPNLGPFAGNLRRKGYKLAHIVLALRMKNIYLMMRFYFKEKFDAVHIYVEKGSFLHILFARISNPHCVIVRSYVDVYLLNGHKRWRRIIERFMARTILNIVSISIGPSVYECEKERFKNPTEILLDWIDTDFYRPPNLEEKIEIRKKIGLDEKSFVISTVGTCNPKKNHIAILNAVNRLKDKNPDLILLHRGTGPDTEFEIQNAEELSLKDRVHFVGYIENIRDVYWASDIFVLTSLYEGLGNVTMEAMSCGLPVVLYDVEGTRDLNFEKMNKGGFWVKPNDVELDVPIHLLANDQNMRKKKSVEARTVAEERFDLTQPLSWLVSKYKRFT